MPETNLNELQWGNVTFVSATHGDFAQAIEASAHAVRVVTANPEMILLARRHSGFHQAFCSADYRTVDGVGLAAVLKKLTGQPVLAITGADFTQTMLERWRGKGLYLLGSTPQNVAAAAEALRAGGVTVAGYRDGFFRDEEAPVVAQAIKDSGAWWLLVGMGAPRQELFLQQHLTATGAHFGMGVGGVIDLLAGKARRAPALWRRLRLEWLFRLFTNPSRWRRYVQLFQFIPLALAAVWLGRGPFDTNKFKK